MILLPRASRKAVERQLGSRRKFARSASRPLSAVRAVLQEAAAQIRAYLAGTQDELIFPVDLSGGSPFQRRVWRAVQRIPYGRVRSYTWVAARTGGRKFARAVGLALRTNPVPLIVPCHRVVAHDGSLGGFSAGLRFKRKLLALEGTLRQLEQARDARTRHTRLTLSGLIPRPSHLKR